MFKYRDVSRTSICLIYFNFRLIEKKKIRPPSIMRASRISNKHSSCNPPSDLLFHTSRAFDWLIFLMRMKVLNVFRGPSSSWPVDNKMNILKLRLVESSLYFLNHRRFIVGHNSNDSVCKIQDSFFDFLFK